MRVNAPDEGSLLRTPSIDALAEALADLDPTADLAAQLATLVRAGADRLPLPGQGATLARWQALAAVAAHDLSLAKLFEGHTDALAILAEIGAIDMVLPGSTWGVWAAEAPQGRTTIDRTEPDGSVVLGGAKCWCSGALGASHALLTAWRGESQDPQLVAIDLDQRGVRISTQHWHSVGMQGSASLDVEFHRVRGTPVGAPGAYLSRPGFWQGSAGIAACWWGGASFIGRALHAAVVPARSGDSPTPGFRHAALGRVDLTLRGSAAVLRECAEWIDAHPYDDAREVALRARLSAEAAATDALAETGRALGAAPFCRDARFARMAADLPVFIRQSHAERDLAALGERVARHRRNPWLL